MCRIRQDRTAARRLDQSLEKGVQFTHLRRQRSQARAVLARLPVALRASLGLLALAERSQNPLRRLGSEVLLHTGISTDAGSRSGQRT